ncbi:MAG: hypothetical protein H7Y22_10545 [Gemmatimonadaceae bacterium]|nr:hypothetical protein [Gloeobacterales cyanobacterium ES-bin-141]
MSASDFTIQAGTHGFVGTTATGKTSHLQRLWSSLPGTDRVLVCVESPETQVQWHNRTGATPHVRTWAGWVRHWLSEYWELLERWRCGQGFAPVTPQFLSPAGCYAGFVQLLMEEPELETAFARMNRTRPQLARQLQLYHEAMHAHRLDIEDATERTGVFARPLGTLLQLYRQKGLSRGKLDTGLQLDLFEQGLLGEPDFCGAVRERFPVWLWDDLHRSNPTGRALLRAFKDQVVLYVTCERDPTTLLESLDPVSTQSLGAMDHAWEALARALPELLRGRAVTFPAPQIRLFTHRPEMWQGALDLVEMWTTTGSAQNIAVVLPEWDTSIRHFLVTGLEARGIPVACLQLVGGLQGEWRWLATLLKLVHGEIPSVYALTEFYEFGLELTPIAALTHADPDPDNLPPSTPAALRRFRDWLEGVDTRAHFVELWQSFWSACRIEPEPGAFSVAREFIGFGLKMTDFFAALQSGVISASPVLEPDKGVCLGTAADFNRLHIHATHQLWLDVTSTDWFRTERQLLYHPVDFGPNAPEYWSPTEEEAYQVARTCAQLQGCLRRLSGELVLFAASLDRSGTAQQGRLGLLLGGT